MKKVQVFGDARVRRARP